MRNICVKVILTSDIFLMKNYSSKNYKINCNILSSVKRTFNLYQNIVYFFLLIDQIYHKMNYRLSNNATRLFFFVTGKFHYYVHITNWVISEYYTSMQNSGYDMFFTF